jgi:signal transduction histidine kinase
MLATKDMECRERLLALGTVAAGLVHEVNNAILPVLLHLEAMEVELARLRAALPAGAADELARVTARWSDARDGAANLRAIARDVLALARKDRDELEPTAVTPALRHALALAGPRLTDRAVVVEQLADVPDVRATDTRLTHVFLNLLINAAHAIPPGEPLRHRITARVWSEPGQVIVAIDDTGAGIDPVHLPRLFDPCFTTRADDEGTGLGLAFVHSAVTSLGGTVTVHSRLGEGTQFRVSLPVADGGG